MTKTIEQLAARVRELEEENARLRFALADTEALELGTSERLATLTRQRDLAVEALESCVRDDDGCIASAIRTIDTIKESEEN